MSYPWGNVGHQGQPEPTLDPKLDIVFFMLFAEQRNRTLLCSLIEAVLCLEVPIDEVEVLHPEPERALAGDKSIALDLRVRLKNGEEVDIEMQSRSHPALRERVLYYWSRMYSGQLSRGGDYGALRRCAVILFANFTMLKARRLHSVFRLQNEAEPLTDHLEVHVVELPKLLEGSCVEPIAPGNDEPRLEFWARFLSATSDAEREALAQADPVMKQAKDALETLSQDRVARVQAEMRETALRAYDFVLAASREEAMAEGKAKGRAEGKAEGRAEGRAEGKAEGMRLAKVEILGRLLDSRFGASSQHLADRLSRASVEEVERALERILTAATPEAVFDAE